jgi:intracellular multiplication protein IcmP
MPDGHLDREKTEQALTPQLGKQWQGYKKAPAYIQVLLAAFALKASRKRQESDVLLGQLAQCWTKSGGLKLTGGIVTKSRKILSKKDIAGDVLNECNRHAYMATALLGALDKARSEGGVLAPAQFLWLRGYDRALWYPLNNLGRQAFHAEAIGAMSHYRAEKQVARPIPKPMLKDAVDVLTTYLENKEKSMPIPQLDFSMVKNKKDPDKNQGVMKPAGT